MSPPDAKKPRLQTDTNIGVGLWSAVLYDDGSGRAWLSERFDEPCEGELRAAQLQAQAQYEKHGAKGHQWPAPSKKSAPA